MEEGGKKFCSHRLDTSKSKKYSTPFTKGESIGYDYLSPDGPKNQCFRVEAFMDDAAGIA